MNIKKRLRNLSLYFAFSSAIILLLIIVVGWLVMSQPKAVSVNAFQASDSLHVSYLTAERIDIIEPDGQLAIALSNSKNSAKLRFDGQIIEGASNRNIPNIIFFDGKGDEVGGLGFANFSDEDSPITAIRHLAFDGYRQDEVITMSHFVQNGKSRKGIYIYDRPETPIMGALEESGILPKDPPELLGEKLRQFREEDPVRHLELWGNPQRVAVQTNEDNEAELILGDALGNVRLRFVVKPSGEAFVEFLDEEGVPVKRIEP